MPVWVNQGGKRSIIATVTGVLASSGFLDQSLVILNRARIAHSAFISSAIQDLDDFSYSSESEPSRTSNSDFQNEQDGGFHNIRSAGIL